MKKLVFAALIALMISSVYLFASVNNQTDKEVLTAKLALMKTHVKDLEAVKSAKDYAGAMDKYTAAYNKLKPRLDEIDKKYPNLHKGEVPEGLKAVATGLRDARIQVIQGHMVHVQYNSDPAVKKASKKFGETMK